jgi:uncharacterized protein YjdB
VTWTTSDATLATVSATGVVTGVAIGGPVTITATSEGHAGTATITVVVPVATVEVTPASASLIAGTNAPLAVTVKDAAGNVLTDRVVVWTTSNAAQATVNGAGVVTGVDAGGPVTITATSEGKSASAAITVLPMPVETVNVDFTTSTTLPRREVQATAHLLSIGGNVLTGRVVTWSTSDAAVATVNATGLISTLVPGTVTITATSEGKSGGAVLTVNVPPVNTVNAFLAIEAVVVGGTVQAIAELSDADGYPLTGRPITWESSNPAVATVSATGLVTGVTVGQAYIKATSEGKTDSASLNVESGASAEPDGLTKITEHTFTSLSEDGWDVFANPSYPNGFRIQQDATAVKSPSGVGEMFYHAGFTSVGDAPAVVERGIGASKTLYVAFWIQLSPNWYGHDGSGVSKILHFWIDGSNRVIPEAIGAGNGTLRPYMALQNVIAGGNRDGGTAANFAPNLVPSIQLVRGQWHKWEIILKANATGVADGTVDWWIDGLKVGTYSGVQFTNSAKHWEVLQWNPTWGGSGGPPLPADQFMRLDHLYISGKP